MNGLSIRCLGVRRYVRDVRRSAEFYTGLFGFGPVAPSDDGADLRFGDMRLELRQATAKAHEPPRSHDLSFRHLAIVVRDMGRAFALLGARDVGLISSGPQTLPEWNPESAGIEALYFRDPDGHALELIRFPDGKGKPIWRRAGADLFLGVDHTAIVVSDLDASLGFYTALGFTLDATARNYGEEQEALSGEPDASLRVATLGADTGSFSLELLSYVAPTDGRPQADALRPGDLAWSETLIESSSADETTGSPFRDPDGHGVSLR